jgi:hypothetical protein
MSNAEPDTGARDGGGCWAEAMVAAAPGSHIVPLDGVDVAYLSLASTDNPDRALTVLPAIVAVGPQ